MVLIHQKSSCYNAKVRSFPSFALFLITELEDQVKQVEFDFKDLGKQEEDDGDADCQQLEVDMIEYKVKPQELITFDQIVE